MSSLRSNSIMSCYVEAVMYAFTLLPATNSIMSCYVVAVMNGFHITSCQLQPLATYKKSII